MRNFPEKKSDYDVFISYRHETGFYMAEIIYTKLTSNGYNVFMDKTMDSGKYEDKIRNALKNSRNFVIILFPEDSEELKKTDSWLNKEAGWAIEESNITIVPIMCDNFQWPRCVDELSDVMKTVSKNNGLIIHKDYSLDSDMDNLCDNFLKNVSPSKPRITATEFFKYNLEERDDLKDLEVRGVDVAFHAGDPWLVPGEKNDMFIRSLNKGIPWRVLINTVESAESIGQHMRNKTALYTPFAQVREHWKTLVALYPDILEVRECEIPLIHVHHAVKFENVTTKHFFGELHIKYYAYNNSRPDNVFEHEISSFSKYYSIYNDEFEFLWNQSKRIKD